MDEIAELEARLKEARERKKQDAYQKNNETKAEFWLDRIGKDAEKLQNYYNKSGIPLEVHFSVEHVE